MDAEVPQRMVDAAIKLLARHGFQGASFGAILQESKAPRGSIYHHFPGGKNELVATAIDLAGERTVALVRGMRGLGTAEIVSGFVGAWRAVLQISDFGAGCSALALTVSADVPELVERAGAVFRSWRAALTDVLEASGLDTDRARALSTMMLAACEGAVVLCRAERSLEPLDTVAEQLQRLAVA
jgi:AcrR family transcriptional regulator